MSKVYVIGHKSPDTDSIAAAISYSYLKQQQGVEAVAARAGEPNKETQYALDYFKAPAGIPRKSRSRHEAHSCRSQ